MKYKILEGRRLLGINMAQCVFPVFWAHIFIDCQKCDQSIGLKFDSNEESDLFDDKKFQEIVKKHNWIFKPGKKILCPKCK